MFLSAHIIIIIIIIINLFKELLFTNVYYIHLMYTFQ